MELFDKQSKKIDILKRNIYISSSGTVCRRGKVNLPTFDGTDYPAFRSLLPANADTCMVGD